MNIIDLFIISTLPAMFLIIWFKTHAFTEYSKLFKLTRFFKIKEFIDNQNKGSSTEYIDYILIKHNSFISRLVSCPYCINFWLTVLTCLLLCGLSLTNISVIYILSLIIYFLVCKIST